MENPREIAYFSMEIGLESEMPTYSGGLGVLAGDTIKSAADLEVPMVAITLLHRKGYFRQKLDTEGRQEEEPQEWNPTDFLTEEEARTTVVMKDKEVTLRAWKYEVKGVSGFVVPVYFLDTDLEENEGEWREITYDLYGRDDRYRLYQEVILGIGGVKMLRALGYDQLERFHMNEGHSSLLTLELLREEAEKNNKTKVNTTEVKAVREKCIFTTHTPVPAGHDHFPLEMVTETLNYSRDLFDFKEVFMVDLLGRILEKDRQDIELGELLEGKNCLNMTFVGINLSGYINGVAKKHGEVSQMMFAEYPISHITNGVHVPTWVSPPFRKLFDEYISGWKEDNFSLRYALKIPSSKLWQAHEKAKANLFNYIEENSGQKLKENLFTIGFARRATAYKRPDLLFRDTKELGRLADEFGPIQVIYAGKAHPRDEEGKKMIKKIHQYREELKDEISLVYLEDYNMNLGRLMTSGVDLWLNTPLPPNEASGTSGMKAALNGVPSLSVLDGWWVEGHIEGITGWKIGEVTEGERVESEENRAKRDAQSLYRQLRETIIPLYYRDRESLVGIMRHCIALNGSFFNTQRMMEEYVLKAYL